MDKTRLGISVVAAVLVIQTLAGLVWSSTPELTAIGLVFNAVAAVSLVLFARRGSAAWVVVGWCAAFFGWHVTGLGALAGWWTTGLEAVFLVGGTQLSLIYQAVLATGCGFAVHLLLPPRTSAS
ncbi:hypothetical protein LFM09_20085 [Lentzea alba]|uniref:hypothetical protein n=1 Tax=Lentzea alba TaxID=2714351 RepID=UPI0039BF856C